MTLKKHQCTGLDLRGPNFGPKACNLGPRAPILSTSKGSEISKKISKNQALRGPCEGLKEAPMGHVGGKILLEWGFNWIRITRNTTLKMTFFSKKVSSGGEGYHRTGLDTRGPNFGLRAPSLGPAAPILFTPKSSITLKRYTKIRVQRRP